MAQHGHSAACCTIPPVSHEYTGKGKYIDVLGMNTYSTGPSTSDSAILFVFDIFGHKPQSIQGADILASSGSTKFQVFVPDLFNGKPADLSWYPPDNKEKEEKLGQFFSTTANPADAAKKLPQIVAEINKQTGGTIKNWAVVGFCWGGKIVSLTTGKDTPFKVAAVAHPAMVDPKEAEAITVPFALLPSKDEPKDDVEAFAKNLKVDHIVEYYPDQIHGFMGARADLKDENVKKNYQKGYETVLNWFHKHL